MVSRNSFVTAAHCVDAYKDGIPENLQLFAFRGSTRHAHGSQVNINKITVHPKYRMKTANDIAVVNVVGFPRVLDPFAESLIARLPTKARSTKSFCKFAGWFDEF